MRLIKLVAMIFLYASFMSGCSNVVNNPIEHDPFEDDLGLPSQGKEAQTHLWGYYDIQIDVPTQTVNAALKRQAMFTANVVQYLNSNPLLLSFDINKLQIKQDYIDVDLDISIAHPFGNLTKFNGYDVRGVLMGNGSGQLTYNTDLKFPIEGVDQFMLPSPTTGYGGPDGYSRWFNFTEFSTGQLPIVEYTQGVYATPGFDGTATLCPYKYFADGLGATDDLWQWLNDNAGMNGVFSAGQTNTRNYFLRFPKTTSIVFGYAILANWEGPLPKHHPANTREAVALDVTITDDLYFVDENNKGGNLVLDISVFDWTSELTGGVMEDYRIFIESSVLSTWKKFKDIPPTGSGEHYFTFHLEIPPDNLHSAGNHELWIIVDYPGNKYDNKFGVPNLAMDDIIAAVFRYNLYVHNAPYKQDPICDLTVDPSTPSHVEEWDVYSDDVSITFDATGSYDPDGTNLTFEWDFDGDGIFDEDPDDSYQGPQDKPTHTYTEAFIGDVCLKLTDENDGEAECCVGVSVKIHPSKNIPLPSDGQAHDLAVNPTNGDLLILFSDKTVYKYRDSDYYDPDDGQLFITVPSEFPTMTLIDVSDLGNNILGAFGRLANFDASGDFVGVNYTIPEPIARDVWTLPDDDDLYENDHCSIWGGVEGPYHYHYVGRAMDPNFNDFLTFHKMTTASKVGYDQLYEGYIKAMEAETSRAIWSLEGSPDYYAARWNLPLLNYDDAYFGTGSATNNDDGWNDCKDLTRGAGNIFYVLDRLSNNEPRIKGWQVEGDITTSLGGFSDSSTISGTPLRIDGSDFVNGDGDNLIFVLHGSSGNYKLSIFFPGELPWG